MLAALFAVKSRCSVVLVPWFCVRQRQNLSIRPSGARVEEAGVGGKAMPDLVLLLHLQVLNCKAMLAASFVVESRCSVV
jgi:hypothetical protein